MTVRLLADLPGTALWPGPPAGETGLPMQTAAWARARASLLGPRQHAHWLAVMDGAQVAALAPLVRQGRWLREPPALHEPSDLAWRDGAALQALAQALAAQPLPLQLDRVPAASPTVGALRKAFARRGVLRESQAPPTPVIHLGAAWSDPERALGARRRADFRRYARRAQRHGELRYELLAPADEASLERALAPALAVDARSWKAFARSALTHDPEQGRFFASFLREAAATGVLRIALLWLGDRPAAMHIATEWRQRHWLLKIAHDSDLADCSPGQLLMQHTLCDAARRGLRSYELLGEAADWTRLWTRETRPYLRLQAYPYSADSAVVAARHLARMGLDRLRARRG